MGKSMIPGGGSRLVDTLRQSRELVSLNADQEKGCGCVLSLQDVENFGSPFGVRSVVKGESDLIRTVSIPSHAVGLGQGLEILVRNLFRIRVNGELSGAVRLLVFYTQNLALTLHIYVLTGRNIAQLVGCAGVKGKIPHAPQGAIFRAQSPQREGSNPERGDGAHVV